MFNMIAIKLDEIHKKIQISRKIVMIVTENESNFVKAFKIFGQNINIDNEEEIVTTVEDCVHFADVDAMMKIEDDDPEDHVLPPHQRCASHTLSLVAVVKDSEKALDDNMYKRLSQSTFAKCSALWRKASRSHQVSEIVQGMAVVPIEVRWNSYYNAMDKIRLIINKMSVDNYKILCAELEIEALRNNEILFLREYCEVMKPVANALDIVQGEFQSYIGILLPMIILLKQKLLDLQRFEICSSLSKYTCGRHRKEIQSFDGPR